MNRMLPWTLTMLSVALSVVAATSVSAASGATCDGRTPTIVGTPGADTIRGTGGADVIAALGGDDRVRAAGGNDVVCGGRGDDTLRGASGNDHLVGGAGADAERGGAGADLVRSAGSSDTFFGDRMHGGTGPDRLFGSGGQDRIWPGRGRDRVHGGTPNPDTILYTHSTRGVEVRLGHHEATGQGHDKLWGIEYVVGSRHDDVLVGDRELNDLVGGATYLGGPKDLGDDVIRGRQGIDFLFSFTCYAKSCPVAGSVAAVGHDHLYGGKGEDDFGLSGERNRAAGGKGKDHFVLYGQGVTMSGGPGYDVFTLQKGRARIDGGSGTDLLTFLGPSIAPPTGPAQVDLRAGTASSPGVTASLGRVENVRGTAGDDSLFGNAAPNRLLGRGGNDQVRGRRGGDYLGGGAGIDTLNGGKGVDTCVSGENVSRCER